MADETTTPPVNTKVKLGGVEYELKNMPTATGLKLYEGLSADFQKQAKQIAEVVTVYAAVAETAEKNGLNPTELAQDWLRSAGNSDAAKAARKTFSSAKQTAIAQLEAAGIDVQSLANMVPGGSQILATANTAAGVGKAVGAVAGVVGAGVDGAWNGTSRMWDLLSTLGKEGWHQVVGYGSGAPKDNALAFGASVMALRQQSLDERHAKPMLDMPFNGQESQLEANPGAVTLSAWDAAVQWIKINVPGVIAFGRWLTTWGENKPSWDQFMAQAEEESRQLAGKQKDFQQLVDARLVGADSEHAKGVLEAAETVAGLKTQGLAHVASAATSGKVTYQDTKGDNVTLEQGQETHRVTPWDRVKEVGHAVVGDGSELQQTARAGAAAGTSYFGLKGAVKGLTGSLNPAEEIKPMGSLINWARKPVDFTHIDGLGKPLTWAAKVPHAVGEFGGYLTRRTAEVTAKVAGSFVSAGEYLASKVPGLVRAVPAVAKVGGAATLFVGPTVAFAAMHEGEKEGDQAKVANAKGDLATLAGDAGIGTVVAGTAAVIAGGGLAALSAPVLITGAGIGALVGGVVTLVGNLTEKEALQGSFAKVENTPDGLMDAAVVATKRAEDARVKAAAAAKGLAMTGTSVAMGAVTQAPAGQPSGTHAPTQQQVVRIS